YHGVVVIYKAINQHPSLSFRVYVTANDNSNLKDISKDVKKSPKKFIKIDKPPACQKFLQDGKRYRLVCEPEAEINPADIEFCNESSLTLKNYIEVYLEKPEDFTLSLVELESDAAVWKAKLRESDWIHYDQNKNEQKGRAGGVKKRKPATSILEEDEVHNKKQKTGNTTGGIETKILTDEQLLRIAVLFGKEWRKIAIGCLQMKMKDIEQIQATENEVNFQKLRVLIKWRDREESNGTAEALYRCLREEASYEILQALRGITLPLRLFNDISVSQLYFKNSYQRVYQISWFPAPALSRSEETLPWDLSGRREGRLKPHHSAESLGRTFARNVNEIFARI
ncbi:PREDICTED: uncharacterized protein LOC104276772, partial [Apaloderma vittatum]|uniref:uncharacterized protein LOC104276772 n=1 Tax=Apaloderma vittatum TaxID=57397 RepID=UPI0005219BD6